jgi:hypothetical protein
VLHPRYKTAYFRHEKWPQEWITVAEDILREQWRTNYKPAEDNDLPSSVRFQLSSIKAASLSFLQQPDDDDHFFSDIDNFGKTSAGDAFEDFLNSPPISNVNDPISWWNGIGDPLARMGLDFLSAPGKSYIHFRCSGPYS